jgi:DNA polymerase III alpha subunit
MSNIESVVEIGEVDTYDLEVDHEDHQYYLANGVLTSNSHSVSYAYDSVACAWLFTYYPDEWVCAWLESAQGKPDEKGEAIANAKRFGYTMVPIDVNYAKHGWTCLPGKKLMPALKSVKGIGDAAIKELLEERPYKDLADLLWDERGMWKHSKANKAAWDALVRLEGLGSLDLVGEGKLFKNYRQLHYVIVEKTDVLKKKDGVEKLRSVIEEANELEDWTDSDKATFREALSGNVDVSILVDEERQERFKEYGVKGISELKGRGLAWFVLTAFQEKKTKNGKDYLLMTVVDMSGLSHKIFVWGGRCCSYVVKHAAYIADVTKSDFGFSTNFRQLKRVE